MFEFLFLSLVSLLFGVLGFEDELWWDVVLMIDGFVRIFEAYGGMDESVQETIQTLITPLIRALGPSHGKLLTLLRTFPPRSAGLALRVLNIFTEVGRPSAQLVALIKALTNERELDARFLIPIIAEMDKVCRSQFAILYLVHLGLMCGFKTGRYLAVSSKSRVYSQRETRTEKPRSFGVQFNCRNTAAILR